MRHSYYVISPAWEWESLLNTVLGRAKLVRHDERLAARPVEARRPREAERHAGRTQRRRVRQGQPVRQALHEHDATRWNAVLCTGAPTCSSRSGQGAVAAHHPPRRRQPAAARAACHQLLCHHHSLLPFRDLDGQLKAVSLYNTKQWSARLKFQLLAIRRRGPRPESPSGCVLGPYKLHQIPSKLQFSTKRPMSPPSSPEEEVPSSPEEQEHPSNRPISPASATPEDIATRDISEGLRLEQMIISKIMTRCPLYSHSSPSGMIFVILMLASNLKTFFPE
nr:uncharacterized protein LOC109747244 [Aegilops tauschii subsp. strangulata]